MTLSITKTCNFNRLPAELRIYIFELLPIKTLTQCNLVCKQWQEGLTAASLNKKITLMKNLCWVYPIVNLIQISYIQIMVRLQIAKAEAIADPSRAVNTLTALRTSFSKDMNLFEEDIVAVEALFDIKKAKQTAQSIQGSRERIEALLVVAEKEICFNHEEAINILEKAKRIIPKITWEDPKLNILLKIAAIEKKIDIKKAIETLKEAKANAKARKETASKFRAYLDVARVEKDICPVEAKQTFLMAKKAAQSIDDECLKLDINLFEIVLLEVFFNLNEAESTALTIDDPDIKLRAQLEVVKAKGIYQKKTFEPLKSATISAGFSNDILTKIFDVEIILDFAKVKQIALSLELYLNIMKQSNLKIQNLSLNLLRAQLEEVKSNAVYRKKIFKPLKNKALSLGKNALSEIVDAEILFDLEEAKKTALSYDESEFKAAQLFKVAHHELQSDPGEAKKTLDIVIKEARSIEDPSKRAKALLKAAPYMTNKDEILQEVIEIAKSVDKTIPHDEILSQMIFLKLDRAL